MSEVEWTIIDHGPNRMIVEIAQGGEGIMKFEISRSECLTENDAVEVLYDREKWLDKHGHLKAPPDRNRCREFAKGVRAVWSMDNE